LSYSIPSFLRGTTAHRGRLRRRWHDLQNGGRLTVPFRSCTLLDRLPLHIVHRKLPCQIKSARNFDG
jgi:hypothetical protein